MTLKERWAAWSQKPAIRAVLVGLGFLLIALTPLVGPIPGPGGIIVFGAGLTLVLKYSGWAKRVYVRLKRKHPRKGAWADWSLRRRSAKRRQALIRERQAAEEAAGLAATNGADPLCELFVGESAAERPND
jgi:hypothetical protein